jgi:hypothetical protein
LGSVVAATGGQPVAGSSAGGTFQLDGGVRPRWLLVELRLHREVTTGDDLLLLLFTVP